MRSEAATVDEYIASLPEDRKDAVLRLRNVIKDNLPPGFEEVMGYGMIGFVVPHSLYPAGYHCNPKLPVPFINIASQKNFIALYHMGVYGDKELAEWFFGEFTKQVKGKIDAGKSCLRFKKPEQIPFDLIGQLARKITVQDWLRFYEQAYKGATRAKK